MAKTQQYFQCTHCQAQSSFYLGRCPECEAWGSLQECVRDVEPSSSASKQASRAVKGLPVTYLMPLSEVTAEQGTRFSSGFQELDRVLGGGILPGAYILLGGDPGIGKSTLMLQTALQLASPELSILYVAGEESPYQIKLRAERLSQSHKQGQKQNNHQASDHIHLLAENQLGKIIQHIQSEKPQVVIIDSIQSIYTDDLSGTPGSQSQIKECATRLMSVAKGLGVTIFIVGHVTKEGAVAGPKLLEHTVDAVLYFEGDPYQPLRLIRSVKNRFGNTHELGVFEMGEAGLKEVSNPSELFLSESTSHQNPGSVIAATVEGSRPYLVEVQALVGQSSYATPRRVANGVEYNRLHQIIAVLERRLGLDFSHQDIYVNAVGGVRIQEPAGDLAIALAIISSARNLSIRSSTVVTGEIGLTGEVRPIRHLEARISEARKIGFQHIIVPQTQTQTASKHKQLNLKNPQLEMLTVRSIMEAITVSLAPKSHEALGEPVV